MKVAFFGVGNMGGPMATNLLKAGYEVNAYDINPEAVEAVIKDGAKGFHSVKDALEGADVVITMVTQGKIVRELYLGNNGILENAPGGVLLIDCSTIDPESSKHVANEAKKKNFPMIDAPVSGGTAGAAGGTLTFIVGGDSDNLDKARPLLEKMGTNIFHAGSNGAGQVAKICNNMLLAIHMIGTSEALSLGVANGLDPKVLSEIMGKSSGNNWSLEKYNPFPGAMDGVPASRDFEGGFGNMLMAKDLGLSQEAALKSNSATPMGAMALNLYNIHSKKFGNLDFSSIIRTIQGK
jgi:3-hydroxyisobutyrate dehydrogenase